MDRIGEAGQDLRSAWPRWLIAVFAAALVAGLAWILAQGSGGENLEPAVTNSIGSFGAFGLALLVLSAALVGFAALYVRAAARHQRLVDELRDSREALRGVDELLDVWQWRTDGANRIVSMRPPLAARSGGEESDWRPEGTPLVWDHLVAEDAGTLRTTLERAAPVVDLRVRHRDSSIARGAVLRARVCTDAQGRFAGYQGTLREAEAASAALTPRSTLLSPQAPSPPAANAASPSASAAAPATATTSSAEQAESDSFSYTVSHDLRAPIRVVEGFTKIVKEDYGRLLDRVGNDHLDRVLGAAARMNNMIDALLALSKLSSQPLVRQAVNLSQLAVYVADDLRRQSPGRQVGIDIQPGMQVEGDPTLLRVVVENLLGNAWKYTSKCEQAQIWFERDPGTDSFTVRDNGAGFDMRFADRLFGVFQRLHSANDFPGTGVGLATVRRIVRRHGGDIWGEAEPNRGARFHFTLPQERDERDERHERQERHERR